MPRSKWLRDLHSEPKNEIRSSKRVLKALRSAEIGTRRFNKVEKMAQKRIWRNSSFADKFLFKQIEKFARHLFVDYGVGIDRAYDLSYEYWRGRSS